LMSDLQLHVNSPYTVVIMIEQYLDKCYYI